LALEGTILSPTHLDQLKQWTSDNAQELNGFLTVVLVYAKAEFPEAGDMLFGKPTNLQ
jgi:hypothetical protein